MSLPGQQPGATAVPGAAPGAVPGAVPTAAAGAQPGAVQAGTGGAQQPTRYSFFNRAPVDPAQRFHGEGQTYRAKLIGIDPVPHSRGDKMCQEVILKQKSVVLASGVHKQRILVQVSLEGIKLLDDETKAVQFVHPVEKISFISRDTTDRRAFGYIVEGEKNKFHFFGIKTGNAAEGLVLALRDLFQVVYDIKQKEKNQGKQSGDQQQMDNLQQGINALNVDVTTEPADNNLVGSVEVASPVTADAAATNAPPTSGGDDLGFLDVQVSSAQEIAAEQSQANKMANIMGAFGSAQAAPMPGMGAPTSFGGGVNAMGMQQAPMVNQVSNNMMNSMAPMGAAPQPTMSMGGGFGAAQPTAQPSTQGGFGGMGAPAPAAAPMNGAGLMAPMASPTSPATPTASNAANAMPKKDDPFASLGALTGIAPKAAPAKAPSMNQQQQNQFNNYMQNNVGAPAAPSNNNSMDIFG